MKYPAGQIKSNIRWANILVLEAISWKGENAKRWYHANNMYESCSEFKRKLTGQVNFKEEKKLFPLLLHSS